MTTPDPRSMTADELIRFCYAQLPADAGLTQWSGGPYRWVMDGLWYRCIRAACGTPEQERERARAHMDMLIRVDAPLPLRCPACHAGPFADLGALSEHAVMMGDVQNREPATGDMLLGFRIEVREDGGAPHVETMDRAEAAR